MYFIFFITELVFQILFSEIVYGGGRSGTRISFESDHNIHINSPLRFSTNLATLKECNLGDKSNFI